MQRVTRPRGGINEWLHWLPVSLHKKLEYLMWRICGERRFEVIVKGQKVMPRSVETSGTTHLT